MARSTLSARLAAIWLLCWSGSAQASPWPATLALDSKSCDEAWLANDELERALRAELEADGVTIAARNAEHVSEARLSLRVSCAGSRTAELVLRAERTEREQQSRLVLADTEASSRARVLALAASDWLRSEWPALSEPGISANSAVFPDAEQAARASPPPEPAPPASAPRAPIPAPERDRELLRSAASTGASSSRFALGFASRWFVDYSNVTWGGALGVDLGRVRLHAEGLFGSASDPLGSASLGSAALGVGYRVLDLRFAALRVEGYPLLAAGVTWLRGDARANAAVAPATSLYGDLRFLLEASLAQATLSPRLGLEVGRASGFVARAADRNLAATGGFFVGANLSARY